jgi:hypothetical protein
VFTARYALSPYIKQIRFFFKGLISVYSLLTAAGSHGLYTYGKWAPHFESVKHKRVCFKVRRGVQMSFRTFTFNLALLRKLSLRNKRD